MVLLLRIALSPRATLLRLSSSSKRLPSSTLRSKVRVRSAPCSANDVSDTLRFCLWLFTVFDYRLGRAVSATDENGATALVQAVRNSHEHVVRALLSAGALPTNLRRKRRALTAAASFPGAVLAVSSIHGELEQLVTDSVVLELVKAAKEK